MIVNHYRIRCNITNNRTNAPVVVPNNTTDINNIITEIKAVLPKVDYTTKQILSAISTVDHNCNITNNNTIKCIHVGELSQWQLVSRLLSIHIEMYHLWQQKYRIICKDKSSNTHNPLIIINIHHYISAIMATLLTTSLTIIFIAIFFIMFYHNRKMFGLCCYIFNLNSEYI